MPLANALAWLESARRAEAIAKVSCNMRDALLPFCWFGTQHGFVDVDTAAPDPSFSISAIASRGHAHPENQGKNPAVIKAYLGTDEAAACSSIENLPQTSIGAVVISRYFEILA